MTGSVRYRLTRAVWLVVRDRTDPLPRIMDSALAVSKLALELVNASDDDKEHFWVVILNARNQYLMHTEVAMGTQSACIVHPREVFGPALREGAHAIIVIHNHPSGDPNPSREDVTLTIKLNDISKLMDIRMHDHIVIGNGSGKWVSLAERGII